MPVMTKMPVPMIAPMPRRVSSNGESTFFSPCTPPVHSISLLTGLVWKMERYRSRNDRGGMAVTNTTPPAFLNMAGFEQVPFSGGPGGREILASCQTLFSPVPGELDGEIDGLELSRRIADRICLVGNGSVLLRGRHLPKSVMYLPIVRGSAAEGTICHA